MKRVLILLFCASSAIAQAPDPLIGTWVMNRERSSFGGPPPQTITLRYEARGDGVRYTGEGLSARGTRFFLEYTARFDGSESQIIGGLADTASHRRIDERTIERIDKRDGRLLQTVTWTLSPDGRELVVAQKGPGIDNRIVYERQ